MYAFLYGRDENINRAQVAALSLCRRLRSLVLFSIKASLVQPLLMSDAGGLTLKTVKIKGWKGGENLLDFARMLPSLRSLESFSLMGERPGKEEWDAVLSDLPTAKLRSLALEFLDASQLKDLANLMTANDLPVLEELYLNQMLISSPKDTDDLSLALCMTPAGRRLKTLQIGVMLDNGLRLEAEGQDLVGRWFDLISRCLGLHLEDPLNETFPCLNNLYLGRVDWRFLATFLKKGRFPELEVIRFVGAFNIEDLPPSIGNEFYEESPEATRLWFSLLQQRPKLRPFAKPHHIKFETVLSDYHQARMRSFYKEFLLGVSRPLDPILTSCFHNMMLSYIDEETCQALAGAIGSGNLGFITELRFSADETCTLPTLTALGKVLNHSFLPCLEEVKLSFQCNDSEDFCLECWCAFFGAMPEDGLSRIRSLDAGSTWRDRGKGATSVAMMFFALAEVPTIFRGLTCLRLTSAFMTADVLNGMSMALSSGALARVKTLSLGGK